MVKILKKTVFIPFFNFFLKILMPIVTEIWLGRPSLVIETWVGRPRLALRSGQGGHNLSLKLVREGLKKRII